MLVELSNLIEEVFFMQQLLVNGETHNWSNYNE